MKADNVGINQLDVVAHIKDACRIKDFKTAKRLIIFIRDSAIAEKLTNIVDEWEHSSKR